MGSKVIFTLVEKRVGDEVKTYWHRSGEGFECRDGSINIKLDVFPEVTFNIRNPKSESNGATTPLADKKDDDIPF